MTEQQQGKNKKQAKGVQGKANNSHYLTATHNGTVLSVSPAFSISTQFTVATLNAHGGIESIFEDNSTYHTIINAIELKNNWEGYAIFFDEKQDEWKARIEAQYLENGNEVPEFILSFSEIQLLKKTGWLETRLLKAISQCTEMLFSDTAAENVVPSVLNTIGKTMDIDRCYISKIIIENGDLYVERRFEWVRTSALNNAQFKSYKKFIYADFFEILDKLNAGKTVAITPNSKVSKSLESALKKLDVLSFLKIPIFKDNNLWGYVGFEDIKTQRVWSVAEKKALKSLSQNIGAHIKINSLTEELISKNRQLENAIEGATDGLWAVDYEANNFYVSPRLCKIFGYDEAEFPKNAMAIKAILKTEDTERLELEVLNALKKKMPIFEFETVAKHKTGKYIWLRGNLTLTYDKKGHVLKNSGAVTDITTEKTFELKIRRQEEHYQRLVNGLKEVVFETDKAGNITFLNSSWKTLIGKAIADSVGKKLASYIEKNHVPTFENILAQIRNKQSWPGRVELQIKGKNKQPYWVEIWLRGMYDANYELTGISGSIFDINNQKIALSQLQESEERYRLISENTKDIVCLHDINSHYIYISPSMYDTLGYPPKALLGQPAWTWIHPDDVDILKEAFQQLINGTQPGFMRYRVKHRKGYYLWVETIANIQQQPAEKGAAPLIQTSTRDIHQQKQAEEEIKKALEKERHLVELRTNLINMISHEFRTPLTSIKSSSDLLIKYLPTLQTSESEVKDRFSVHFERIRAQVNRINDLISGVLLLGRMDTGKIQFLPEPIDFKEFVAEFFTEYFDTHTEDSRSITTVYEGEVREVEIDRLLLTHILRNLVSNALKYSQGSKSPELYIKFEKKRVKIIIKDYGIGIAEKDIKNLFQSFYRGDNALTIPGTGLGLVIVKQFVDMHGGDIELNSELNKGTTIQIILPI